MSLEAYLYANFVWCPYLKKDILAVKNVQRRTPKLLPGLKAMSHPERLKVLKLPSLVNRRLRGDMIEAFNILNDESVASEILSEQYQQGNEKQMSHNETLHMESKAKYEAKILQHENNRNTFVYGKTYTRK